MNITKYPQSCLKIEHDKRALLVDIGTLTTPKFGPKDFGELDAVLFTHSHPDHFDVSVLGDFIAAGVTIYGNSDIARAAGEHKVEVIEDGEELVIADFKIKAYHMEHCLMLDGSKGVPNTGFLINDGLLLPGDSTEDIDIAASVVALPIFGPDISYHDAFQMALTLGAKHVVPVHYDVASIDPGSFKMLASLGGALPFEYHPLEDGESVDL